MKASELDERVIVARKYIDARQCIIDGTSTPLQKLAAKRRIANFKLEEINDLCGEPFDDDIEAGVLAIAILTIIAK